MKSRTTVQRLRQWLGRWAQHRQGPDEDSIRLHSRRIYILPNSQGIAFGFLLVAMIFGAMNYNNSLGLAVAFLLAGLGLVTMHHCHRNLSGLVINCSGDEPAFAGQTARFRITLVNDATVARFGLTLRRGDQQTDCVHLEPGEHRTLTLTIPALQRGRLRLERFGVFTTFPLGLFHCWVWVYPQWSTLVYPRPAPPGLSPPPQHTDTGGASDAERGDADFAGLRAFRDGDSPRHVAWKAYARDAELMVKQYAGTDVTTHLFDFDTLDQMAPEARLSQLTRWVIDAHVNGHAWSLRLPGRSIEPGLGPQHRDLCLRALALA